MKKILTNAEIPAILSTEFEKAPIGVAKTAAVASSF
jgi:hypothetical protein